MFNSTKPLQIPMIKVGSSWLSECYFLQLGSSPYFMLNHKQSCLFSPLRSTFSSISPCLCGVFNLNPLTDAWSSF